MLFRVMALSGFFCKAKTEKQTLAKGVQAVADGFPQYP
jgi:hypothetical protein